MTIEMRGVSCGYGGQAVLEGFSAAVSSGEIFCLLGPNGSGKTTLFKTILGVLPLLAGTITIDGRDSRSLSARDFARFVGYVPQSHTPPFAFSVHDVIVMGRTVRLGTFGNPKPADYDFAEAVMERLGIGHLRDRYYTQLSGGERQMALIARALAQEPSFMLMDEPTSNLDFGNQAKALVQILSLAERNLGIIMTTHYPEHVLLLNGRGEGRKTQVALLKSRGRVESGEARETLTEKTLSETYGVQVAVMDVAYQNRKLPFCQPILAGRANNNGGII